MSIVLRVDVDKPYGRVTFKEKVLSKVREDYCFPAVSSIGYLNHLKIFLAFLSKEGIKAHIYFRQCTLPPKRWLNESIFDGHKLGLHAENTRNLETLKKELEYVQAYFFPEKISSFTKHGSGQLSLGRNHYPSYEPDKYLKWSETLGIPFLFGNGEINKSIEFPSQNHFYSSMFWIDRYYSNREAYTLQWVIDNAKEKNVVVIIHPANYMASKQVKGDMRKLVSLARQQNVSWITI